MQGGNIQNMQGIKNMADQLAIFDIHTQFIGNTLSGATSMAYIVAR